MAVKNTLIIWPASSMAMVSKPLSIKKDYQNPKFTATWGVSDEDLFDKANETFTQLHNEGKPFFSLVFSSSKSRSFRVSRWQIELYEQPKATRNNSAKYADYAIGHFFKLSETI